MCFFFLIKASVVSPVSGVERKNTQFFVQSQAQSKVKNNNRIKKHIKKKKESKTTRAETLAFDREEERARKKERKDESDGVIAVEMARAKRGPGVFGQSRRRGRIRLFPKSLGERDAHVYI